jgi:putative pyruvate formate lyase activating enzyme
MSSSDLPKASIAWAGKHFGEEPPLVGNSTQGAGGIFFSGCHLKCVFCQNYQISQGGLEGELYDPQQLADLMLKLQNDGAVNIDLVTPTIWWQQLKLAIPLARKSGLKIPIVWNSNGYEAIELLKNMDGLVEIYLPDFKYGLEEVAWKYSGIHNYPSIALNAIKEMSRQVGNLQLDEQTGLATRGVLVRHLILPNNLENSRTALKLLADFDQDLFISLMSQYYPLYGAVNFPEINREVTVGEAEEMIDYLWSLNLQNGWTQEPDSSQQLIPDFTKINPFK